MYNTMYHINTIYNSLWALCTPIQEIIYRKNIVKHITNIYITNITNFRKFSNFK